MFKKIMSLMLAVMMIMSVAVMATSAAQVEIADNSADAVAEVAADAPADVAADAPAETGAANKLSFDPSNTGWNNYKTISCHIWEYGNDAFYAWGSKKEKCDDNGDGTWSYDLDAKGITIESGKLYAIIFYNDLGMQSHNLLFDTTVLGDTAYCKDPNLKYENPEDSNKTSVATFWKGQDETKYGPEMCITSIGNVVGTCVPYTTSSQKMLETFLAETLSNALSYSGKDEQTLIDDTAKALGLKKGNVEEAIKNAGVTVDWKADKSPLDDGTDEKAKQPENNGGGTTSSENNGGGTTSSGNTTTSSGSSTTKTGTGSTTQTGQETTVLFIMFGVMIAAAAVIVIAKKRDRA